MEISQQKFFDKKVALILLFIVVLGFVMRMIGPPDCLDAKLFYSGEQARALINSFSESDLRAYFLQEILDLGFLTSYTTLFLLMLRRLSPAKTWLLIFPVIVGLSDLVETTVTILVLKFSGSKMWFDWLGLFTFVKWVLGAIVALIIFTRLFKVKFSKSRSAA